MISFELSDDPALVAAAGPGEQPWKARLALEGVMTGDRRLIEPMALDWRDLPLTLGFQETTPEGFNPHGGAVASGRIETIERVDLGNVAKLADGYETGFVIEGTGVFTADPEGVKAAGAVRDQKVRGVSVDVDSIESRYDAEIDPESGMILSEREVLISGRVMGAIVAAHPAFAEAVIELVGEPPVEDVEPVAASAGRGIPRSFFDDLDLDRLTPFTVAEIDGLEGTYEVFGHIAPRNVCHLGLPGCRTVPTDGTYEIFHSKSFEVDDGFVSVGVLTMGGLHTGLRRLSEASVDDLLRSFEDTGSVAAYVRAGHDAYGVWVHGVTRYGISIEDVESLRGSNPSGEWKPVGGRSELLRVHNVPVGAFPVPRPLVASALYRGEDLVAYISAGVPRAPVCEDEDLDDVEPLAASAAPVSELLVAEEPLTASGLTVVEALDEILRRQAQTEAKVNALARFSAIEIEPIR